MTRAGFVAVAGRPNVGKSTLVNRVVGGKVSIVSNKPQTTRRAVRGIVTTAEHQLVLVDLPGSQRPLDALTARMQRRVESELSDSDAVLLVLNGEQGAGPGDRFLARAIAQAGVPAAIAVNKMDRLSRARTVEALMAAASLELDGEIYPLSARDGTGVDVLVDGLVALLPEGPFLYPPEDSSDQPLEQRIAELIREQALRRTRDEVPHAVESEIEEMEEREDGLLVIVARLWAETDSQKAILVGKGGRMVGMIGTSARGEIEHLLGRRVHLDLTVRVRRGWRRDEGLLDRLGIE